MKGIKLDDASIYRGKDIVINKNFYISIPTIDQIFDFGEQHYMSAMHILNSCGADMKWQLWDYHHIDYTKIEDYELFILLLSKMLASRRKIKELYLAQPEMFQESFTQDELDEMDINPLELTLKYTDGTSVDLGDFDGFFVEKINQKVLYNKDRDITIDKMLYSQIVDVIRKIHGFKRNNQIPGNEMTKMDLIEDARDEAMINAKKPYKSVLLPLVSTMKVYTGQVGTNLVYQMNIAEFFYDIKRVMKVQDATMLLQGAYSGFASLKGIDKSRLDMFGDI